LNTILESNAKVANAMPVSLHTHSWYSLLEATASPATLLRRAAQCGYSALALTDTNNLYGAMNFVKEATVWGIRPLLGSRLRQQQTRVVALIADPSGYASLCRILSRLHLSEEPLVDLLQSSSTGLHILVDDLNLADQLRDAYPTRLWIEVVRPAGNARRQGELIEGARGRSLPLIASTAAHLAGPADYPAFRVGVAVQRNLLLEQLPSRLGLTPAHHLIESPAWPLRFPDLPDAVRNTDLLASQLQHDVLPHATILPRPRVPRDWEPVRFLRALCERGLIRRGLAGKEEARQRLARELEVLANGNLPGYFLIVRDIARHARNQGLSMALRGSAGNCLVCYLLEITDVDPLRFQLPLERFLHPGRPDLPDIDLDFDWKTRDQVIEWVFKRHGDRHTAMISTHLFLQPRSAFREAAKIHGLSSVQITQLLGTFSERMEGMVSEGRDLPRAPASFPLEPERWPHLMADARRLLGRPHHLSIHPGGVVITPGPIEECAPLQRAPKGVVITQFEKDAAEFVGLVKIDLLGNRALSSVDAAAALLKQHLPCAVREQPAWLKSSMTPPDFDAATIALLQRGDTLGVNQLESPAMRRLLIQMKPAHLLDVIQALAMIRPGAASVGMKEVFVRRRAGLEPVRNVHPKLAEILGETEGLMVFEDDALRVVQALTGLAATEADHFRKRITRHRTIEEARVLTLEFLTACNRNGIARPAAEEIWVQLAKFNSYSFCKSHAVSYGLIAWKASFLKAHFPLCQWTAALNNNQGMYGYRVYVEAIKREGLRLILPCINRSISEFAVEDGAIRTGMNAIAGLDDAFRQRLIDDRTARGPYASLADLRRRLEPGPETLSVLIRAGALDCLGESRPALFLAAELPELARGKAPTLFHDDPELEWGPRDYETERRLLDEWDVLGFVVGPPLLSLLERHLPAKRCRANELEDKVGRQVVVAGVVAASRQTTTENGRQMQFITLEDETGLIDVTLFPGNAKLLPYLQLGPYQAVGVVEEQYGALTLNAQEVRNLARSAH
jgi:DNA-directed DNA polymerase III PolC